MGDGGGRGGGEGERGGGGGGGGGGRSGGLVSTPIRLRWKALTGLRGLRTMTRMRRSLSIARAVVVLAGMGALVGCDDAAKHPVQAHIPVTTPGPQIAAATLAPQTAPQLAKLPAFPLSAKSRPLVL